jgi:hypothetical protein
LPTRQPISDPPLIGRVLGRRRGWLLVATACFSGGRTLVMRQPVEHESERRARDPEREGESDCPPDPMGRVTEGDAGQHGHDGENRY